MTEKQEVTAEQYKAEILKQNFARRCADYEDHIASLQTQLAIAQQRLGQYEDRDTDNGTESPSNELAPPPPPTVPGE